MDSNSLLLNLRESGGMGVDWGWTWVSKTACLIHHIVIIVVFKQLDWVYNVHNDVRNTTTSYTTQTITVCTHLTAVIMEPAWNSPCDEIFKIQTRPKPVILKKNIYQKQQNYKKKTYFIVTSIYWKIDFYSSKAYQKY